LSRQKKHVNFDEQTSVEEPHKDLVYES
jgi:hypothetical protein